MTYVATLLILFCNIDCFEHPHVSYNFTTSAVNCDPSQRTTRGNAEKSGIIFGYVPGLRNTSILNHIGSFSPLQAAILYSQEHTSSPSVPYEIYPYPCEKAQLPAKKKTAKKKKEKFVSSRILCCSGNTPVPETSIRMRKTDRVLPR